ncbi:MAG: deoxyribose-phosphate aldolase [Chloroflexi bacterium]|nr:deoxyribose-phosphate aldolase [Chloroflexota bacterium]
MFETLTYDESTLAPRLRDLSIPQDPATRRDWLRTAITLIDLTTLNGYDTPDRVHTLVEKAQEPLPGDRSLTVAAICVYPARVPDALGTPIPVATVSAGFPSGQIPVEPQLEVARQNIAQGATEIDMVINRTHALLDRWQDVQDEVAAFRGVCGDSAHLKVILETGELGTAQRVYRAAWASMAGGADFIKTSTGKASENATLEKGLVMLDAIRDYQAHSGRAVGFKPAGGIRSADDALRWMALVRDTLGPEWITPARFRIGASSLLDVLVAELTH